MYKDCLPWENLTKIEGWGLNEKVICILDGLVSKFEWQKGFFQIFDIAWVYQVSLSIQEVDPSLYYHIQDGDAESWSDAHPPPCIQPYFSSHLTLT